MGWFVFMASAAFGQEWFSGELDNGIFYVQKRLGNSSGLARVYCIVRVGSEQERPSEAGISHLLEHSIFLTLHGPRRQTYDSVLNDDGVNSNANTTNLQTTYLLLDFPESRLEFQLQELANALLFPEFVDETAWKKEREVVWEEVSGKEGRTSDDFVEGLAGEDLLGGAIQAMTRDLTLDAWGPGGFPSTVADLELSSLRRYHALWYVPERMQVVVVSDQEPGEVRRMLDSSFGRAARSGQSVEPSPAAFLPGKFRFLSVESPRPDNARLMLAFPAPSLATPEAVPLLAISALLERRFGDWRERLFGADVFIQPLVVGGGLRALILNGHLRSGSGGGFGEFFPLLDRICAELQRLKTEPLEPGEWTRLQVLLRERYLAPGSEDALLAFLGFGSFDAYQRLGGRLAALTPEELQSAARRFLDWNQATLAVQGEGAYLLSMQSVFVGTFWTLALVLPLALLVGAAYSLQRWLGERAAFPYFARPIARHWLILSRLTAYCLFAAVVALACILLDIGLVRLISGRWVWGFLWLVPVLLPAYWFVLCVYWGLFLALRRPYLTLAPACLLFLLGHYSGSFQHSYQSWIQQPMAREAFAWIFWLLPKFDMLQERTLALAFGDPAPVLNELIWPPLLGCIVLLLGLLRFRRAEI